MTEEVLKNCNFTDQCYNTLNDIYWLKNLEISPKFGMEFNGNHLKILEVLYDVYGEYKWGGIWGGRFYRVTDDKQEGIVRWAYSSQEGNSAILAWDNSVSYIQMLKEIKLLKLEEQKHRMNNSFVNRITN